jgi:hypothetical protein
MVTVTLHGKHRQSAGTATGDIQYWNGTAWVVVAATTNEEAALQMIGGVPTWVGGTAPPPPPLSSVTIGEQTWTDRNLDVATYRDGTQSQRSKIQISGKI